MHRYEKETQHFFVSSERLFGSGGTQNHFKIELNDAPFHNTDSSILRLSLQQFNMCKNYADVNYTNNKMRMFMKGFTKAIGNTTITFANIGTIITIPCGYYADHPALAAAFIKEVEAVLDGDTNRTGSNDAVLDVTAGISTDFRLTCQLSMGTTGVVDVATGETTAFAWDEVPRFVCLNVPNGTFFYNVTGGTGVAFDERFNDSCILLGGRRIEAFEGTPLAPIWDMTAKVSLSSKAAGKVCHIQPWYPMNNALHTSEYIYITSPQCHSQAPNNLVEMSSSHAHKFIASNIIGKAMAVTNDWDGSVFL